MDPCFAYMWLRKMEKRNNNNLIPIVYKKKEILLILIVIKIIYGVYVIILSIIKQKIFHIISHYFTLFTHYFTLFFLSIRTTFALFPCLV